MSAELTNQLDMVIPLLEAAIPQVINTQDNSESLQRVNKVGEMLKAQSFAALDPNLPQIGQLLIDLTANPSLFLANISFQMYLLDLLETLSQLYRDISAGTPSNYNFSHLLEVAYFLQRLTNRATVRYKLKIDFNPEYEGKFLRAFQALKDLQKVARFLVVNPDIASNNAANLDGGFEVEILSNENPKKLHEIASSVLEVESVQVYSEQKTVTVFHLDPPEVPGSVDQVYKEFLN